MAKAAIIFGGLLFLLGAYCFGVTGGTHYTALIPTGVGILMVIGGILALVFPKIRMHSMHLAALAGALGVLLAIGGLIARRPSGIALIEMILLLVISALFVVLCVFSFIAARRGRA